MLEAKLKLLQHDLAQIDLITASYNQSSSDSLELLLMKLKEIKLKMYQERGHFMPHIHIDYGKQHHVASFSINPIARIEGTLPKKYNDQIVTWISSHKEELLKIWIEAQQGGDPVELISELSC